MTEFAFSGVGINPHHGTPANPATRRADPIAAHPRRLDLGRRGLGRDRRRLGRARLRHRRLDPHPGGAAGPGRLQEHRAADADRRRRAAVDDARHRLRRSRARCATRCCCTRSSPTAASRSPRGRSRRCASRCRATLMLDGLEPPSRRAFERALDGAVGGRRARSRRSICRCSPRSPRSTPPAASPPPRAGPGTAAGSPTREPSYDPRVAARIRRGEAMSAADYIDLLRARRDWIARMAAALHGFDALLSPDGADRRAAARAAGRRRRRLLRRQRPAAAQPVGRQPPRRLRALAALPRRRRAAGRADGLERRAGATTPCSTPRWRSRRRSRRPPTAAARG